MQNFLHLTIWEAPAGGASHSMNVSCVKTPLFEAFSTEACLNLNMGPKGMGQLAELVWPGFLLGWGGAGW